MSQVDQAIETARANRAAHLDRLKEFLTIPSISTLSEYRDDMTRCAQWVREALAACGLDRVEILPTGGYPVVYGEYLGAQGKPTVLVYGHYDVQPADPLDEWETPPFVPTVRGDNLYARGASDMKGQIFACMLAAECLAKHGKLPLNLKFLVEGEEEIGSPNLAPFIERHKDRLACDFMLNCDTRIERPDQPSIVHTLRGLAYFELTVKGAKQDLHSGLYGGAVHNPAQVLCDLIAGMHDAQGKVTLPGFYDRVRDLDPEEREMIAKFAPPDEEIRREVEVKNLWGEAGYSASERTGARPTLEVNGLLSGFTGEGSKTVLPAKAMAKISMRLVPDQRPEEVADQFRAYIEATCPDTVTWSIAQHAGSLPGICERDSPALRAAMQAQRTVFGVEPIFARMGGTVPVVAYAKKLMGVDTVMMGFALPTDCIHGPNEKQHIPNFYNGIETYIRFLASL